MVALPNIIIGAVVKELTARGMEMERDGSTVTLTGEKDIVSIDNDSGMIIISIS